MGSAQLSYAVQKAVTEASSGLSAAKKEGFQAGAEFALSVLSEMAVDQAIGVQVRGLVRDLTHAQRGAQETLKEFNDISHASELLDERGKQILALTQTLLEQFKTAGKSESGMGRSEMTDQATIKMFNCVSYIVWAYASNSSGNGSRTTYPDPEVPR